MKLSELPDKWIVTLDTETSKLHPDDGGRIAAASFAYRVPNSEGLPDFSKPMKHVAVPFDQGISNLPLGEKDLDAKTIKRLSRWPDWALDEDARNLSVDAYKRMVRELSRMNLVFHNAKFDMHMFRTGLRGVEVDTAIDLEDAFMWDTMSAQKVIDPKFPTALKETGVRLHLGRELGVKEGMEDDEAEALKPWLGPKQGKFQDPRYDLVPWSIMGPYAGMDAALTLLLLEWQWREMEDMPYNGVHVRREKDLMTVLYRMETRGVGFDIATGNRMEKLIEEARGEVASRLPFDPTPNNARKYFFGDVEQGGLGHMPFSDKLTDKKKEPQVDDEVITRLASEEWEGQAVAKVYQEHEGLKSANAKWYSPWPAMTGMDGRIRTTYNQVNVVSGRLAVSRFQSQAIPHNYQLPKVEGLVGVRDLFVEYLECPCGCGLLEMWEFDVSQAEIRIATAKAQCRPMLDGFEAGLDSHTIATKLMFGERLVDEGYEGREFEHPSWEQWRQVGKRCNLGILYGAGAKVIQEQLLKFANMRVPIKQVSAWISDWKAAFPQMTERLHLLEDMAVNVGYVRLVNGKMRHFSPYEELHKAFNQEIQGSLAEVMKDIMIHVENVYPDMLLLQTHDSLTLRIPKCQLEDVKEGMTFIMKMFFEEAFTERWKDCGQKVTVPFVSDAKQFGRKVAA